MIWMQDITKNAGKRRVKQQVERMSKSARRAPQIQVAPWIQENGPFIPINNNPLYEYNYFYFLSKDLTLRW